MAKASKQTIIDAIIKEIELGKGRAFVLGKIGKKWEISRTTFDRHWKIANDQQKERQEKASKAADAAYIKAKEKAAISAVMSSHERKELLTKIANGQLKIKKLFIISGKIKEYPAEPDHTDRKNAIAELNKMDGSYAPTKLAQTNTAGDDITPPLNDSQVDKLLKAIKSKK